MNDSALKGFAERFRDILDELDDFADDDDMDELNAQLQAVQRLYRKEESL